MEIIILGLILMLVEASINIDDMYGIINPFGVIFFYSK